MTLDRAELTGLGAAVVFHVGLIAALSLSLARIAAPPEPPAMEVELVEEVGLQAAAPASTPPAAQAPEMGEAPIEQPAPAPAPAPRVEPLPPAARIIPTPEVNAAERRKREIEQSKAAKPTPAKPAPRVSRLGDDFLKGVGRDVSAPAQPAAATFNASALAGIAQAIRRQVQPCADRQVNPGPGASRIRVRLHLRLSRSGRLIGPPEVAGVSGVDDENERFVDRVKDLAVATFVGCAPLSGLPPELYKTADGRGWGDFYMNYNLP